MNSDGLNRLYQMLKGNYPQFGLNSVAAETWERLLKIHSNEDVFRAAEEYMRSNDRPPTINTLLESVRSYQSKRNWETLFNNPRDPHAAAKCRKCNDKGYILWVFPENEFMDFCTCEAGNAKWGGVMKEIPDWREFFTDTEFASYFGKTKKEARGLNIKTIRAFRDHGENQYQTFFEEDENKQERTNENERNEGNRLGEIEKLIREFGGDSEGDVTEARL